MTEDEANKSEQATFEIAARLLRERDELRMALLRTLSALVATTSLIIRAEDIKKQPSKAVASDKMFRQMLKDYDAATIAARAALSRAQVLA